MAIQWSFKTICETAKFEHEPPTWLVLNYQILKHAGSKAHLGQEVIASGEASVSSYNPKDFALMYFSTINGVNHLAYLSS